MSAKKLFIATALLLSATSATLAQGYSATRVWGHGVHLAQYGGGAAPANPGAGISSQR